MSEDIFAAEARELAKGRTEESHENRTQHGHPDFYVILNEMADLHSSKNHDYAGDDPLSNLRTCEEIGVPAWKGVLVRLMDKWSRLKQFAKQGVLEVKDESIEDTLMDNAVYSILCIILRREERKNAEK